MKLKIIYAFRLEVLSLFLCIPVLIEYFKMANNTTELSTGNDTIVIPFGSFNLTEIANIACLIVNTSRHGKPMSTGFLSFVAIFYVLVIIFGIIGNGLIIVAFYRGPKLRRVTVNVIMVHMAIVNLIHVCIANPFALIKNYDPDLIENKMVNCLLAMSFWMCFTISLYSLVAISVNRYLLIARPTTTFRRFCTGHAITIVLISIWLLAFLIHFSLWLQLAWFSRTRINHEHATKCKFHEHRITSMELVVIYSLVIFVPPVILVPLMHSLTLYTMRSSTRRVQRAAEAVMVNRQKASKDQSKSPSGTHLDISIPITAGASGLMYSRSDAEMVETTFQLVNQSLRAAAIVINPPPATSSDALEVESTGARKKGKRLQGMLCVCCDEADVGNGPQRPRLGRPRGELRLIRLMMSVYVILIVTWIPTLITMTDVFDLTELHIHGLVRLGLLYPLFPSLVPYVYLWSNRNFQRTLRRSLKRKTSSKIYKPPVNKVNP